MDNFPPKHHHHHYHCDRHPRLHDSHTGHHTRSIHYIHTMRASPLVLALPLAAAQQFPMLDSVIDQAKGWFAKASGSVAAAVSSATESASIPNPVASGAVKIAQLNVHRVDLNNFQELIKPGSPHATPGIETWEVFVTGGNKTCFGMCNRAETAFNESVALVAASPNPPNLGLLNCETE